MLRFFYSVLEQMTLILVSYLFYQLMCHQEKSSSSKKESSISTTMSVEMSEKTILLKVAKVVYVQVNTSLGCKIVV